MVEIFFENSKISFKKQSTDAGNSVVELNNKKSLHGFLADWLQLEVRRDVILYGYDRKQMKIDFKAFFFYLEAAGGVVFNKNKEVLFIYRSGIWDLPKGKMDKNEDVEHCALREVEEETGVRELRITEKLKPSFHIYWHKDKWYLKKTHWFFMRTDSDHELVPQVEEEITQARWMNQDECRTALSKTFRSLRDSIGDEICACLVKHPG
jgi:8-oxo-dGTP pyrophosphatase MutT (NUDIX family)